MWDIARAHGMSVDELARINKISSRRRIYPGQILRVTDAPLASAARTSSSSPARRTYRVRPGDTLWEIARRHGTSVSALTRANKLSSRSRIYPGQILTLPAGGSSVRRGSQTYVVRRGDNLTRIARQFGIGVSDILERNRIVNPERIAIGMKLVIPEGK
jgi:putative chitinase